MAIRCIEEQSEWTPNDYTVEIAAALIEAGASLEKVKMTLAAAVCLGRADDVARLAVDATFEDRQKALAAVAYNGKVEAIPLLIGLGADPNAPNIGLHPHATALHNAVCSGSLETVKALVAAGARLDVGDTAYQGNALSWAEYFVREKRGAPMQDGEIAEFLRAMEKGA